MRFVEIRDCTERDWDFVGSFYPDQSFFLQTFFSICLEVGFITVVCHIIPDSGDECRVCTIVDGGWGIHNDLLGNPFLGLIFTLLYSRVVRYKALCCDVRKVVDVHASVSFVVVLLFQEFKAYIILQKSGLSVYIDTDEKSEVFFRDSRDSQFVVVVIRLEFDINFPAKNQRFSKRL